MESLLPRTDTRFRPDQRLYENGRVDEADKEKERLEQKQRDTRKELEAQGEKWNPQWFQLTKDTTSTTGQSWVYKGGYWESRGQFKTEIDLYS